MGASEARIYPTVVFEDTELLSMTERGEYKPLSLDEAVEQIKKRRASEKVRYQNLYGVDIMDMANYDLVIKTDDKTPKELAQIICEEFEKFLTKGV